MIDVNLVQWMLTVDWNPRTSAYGILDCDYLACFCLFGRYETIPLEQWHRQHLEGHLLYEVHPIFAD